MKKAIALLFWGCVLTGYSFSQTVNATVEITGVVVDGGFVYLLVFSNADGFMNENPYIAFRLEANNSILSQDISLRNGEYVISVFQDANNNQKLDYGLFGIPKELFGMSNYFGKGYPSKNFDRQKIMVNDSTGKIVIGLYKF